MLVVDVDVDADVYDDVDPRCQQTAPRWAINYKPGDIPKPATGKRPARRCVAGCNLIDLNRAEIMTDSDYSASFYEIFFNPE